MIEKIQYVDFGYMSSAITIINSGKEIEEKSSAIVREPYFRVGWKDRNSGHLILAFYNTDDILKILADTECLSIMNLVGREIEVQEGIPGPSIVKFLK